MRALIIGRFQPPHRGHFHAIQAAAKEYDSVLVAIGSAQYAHTSDNPFSAGERSDLLRAGLEELGLENVHVFAVTDIHDHPRWVEHVVGSMPAFDVVLTHNPVTKRLFEDAGYKVRPVALWRPQECSGRRIRDAWARGKDASDLLLPSVAKKLKGLQGPQRVARILREAPHERPVHDH